MNPLRALAEEIVGCRRCPRLVEHRETMARVKRRAYLDWEYWGKPVPAFGDPRARLLIIGLAPGAHGANRTGRVFTGDRSGDFLYRALFESGFASQAESVSRGDGLRLRDAYITGAARCAPPENKLLPEELVNCRPYLERELDLLSRVKVIVVLGKLAFDTYLKMQRDHGMIPSRSPFAFGHDRSYKIGGITLLASYHPSQQNTFTGKLTAEMLRDVFDHARLLLESDQVLSLGKQ